MGPPSHYRENNMKLTMITEIFNEVNGRTSVASLISFGLVEDN